MRFYLSRFREFIPKLQSLREKKLFRLLPIVIIVAILPVTVFVAQQRQEIRQRASEPCRIDGTWRDASGPFEVNQNGNHISGMWPLELEYPDRGRVEDSLAFQADLSDLNRANGTWTAVGDSRLGGSLTIVNTNCTLSITAQDSQNLIPGFTLRARKDTPDIEPTATPTPIVVHGQSPTATPTPEPPPDDSAPTLVPSPTPIGGSGSTLGPIGNLSITDGSGGNMLYTDSYILFRVTDILASSNVDFFAIYWDDSQIAALRSESSWSYQWPNDIERGLKTPGFHQITLKGYNREGQAISEETRSVALLARGNAPTATPGAGGGTACPEAPGAITTIRSGNRYTLSWQSVAHASWYDVRVEGTGARPVGATNSCDNHEVCINRHGSSAIQIEVVPGNNYRAWVHAGGGTCAQSPSSGVLSFLAAGDGDSQQPSNATGSITHDCDEGQPTVRYNWSISDSDFCSVQILRGVGDPYTELDFCQGSGSRVVDNNRPVSMILHYDVRDSSGRSTPRAETIGEFTPQCPGPGAPTPPPGGGSFRCEDDAEDHYRCFRWDEDKTGWTASINPARQGHCATQFGIGQAACYWRARSGQDDGGQGGTEPTFTPAPQGGSCPTDSPSQILVSGNDPGSTRVNISWPVMPNAQWYDVRVEGDGASPVNASNTCNNHEVCINEYRSSSLAVNVRPGGTYTVWAHSGGPSCSQTSVDQSQARTFTVPTSGGGGAPTSTPRPGGGVGGSNPTATPIQSPTFTPAPQGGSCPTNSPSQVLVLGADAGATRVTLSWTVMPNAQWYDVRVDGNGARPVGVSNSCTNHGVCVNQYRASSMQIEVRPGSTYSAWVHAGGPSCAQTGNPGSRSFTVPAGSGSSGGNNPTTPPQGGSSASCTMAQQAPDAGSACISCIKTQRGGVNDIKALFPSGLNSCSDGQLINGWCNGGISSQATSQCNAIKTGACASSCGGSSGRQPTSPPAGGSGATAAPTSAVSARGDLNSNGSVDKLDLLVCKKEKNKEVGYTTSTSCDMNNDNVVNEADIDIVIDMLQ